MNTFDKISKQIKDEDIKQTPKWYFFFKNARIWAGFLISVIIGAMAFSVILFSVQQADFVLLNHAEHSKFESILVFLPFFWIVILIIFSIFAFYSIRSSKKAYKYSLMSLIRLSTFLSILIGTLFFISGGAQKLEQSFANKIEAYNSLQEKKLQIWLNPTEGLLAGEIIKTVSDTIYLKDFSKKEWKIVFKDVYIPPILELERGEEIKLVGVLKSDTTFIAKEIRPWRGLGEQSNKALSKKINKSK